MVRRAWVFAGVLLGAAVCSAALQSYELKGEVVQVQKSSKQVTIHHQQIPGFMMEMTMPFFVRDARLLEGLEPGDQVEGKLAVDEGQAWLSALRVTRKAAPPAARQTATTASAAAALPPVEPLQAGQAVPDFTFTDQSGATGSLSHYRGKALGLTFIFTRCPLPNYCPALTRNFRQVQLQLAKQPQLLAKTHLFSVSMDPAYDTPAVLRSYGEAQKADFAHWSFVQADTRQTQLFGRRFNLYYEGAGLGLTHNMRSIIISPEGKLVKIYEDSNWDPKQFAADLARAAR